jgi:ABC-type glycerol-3-phosphate transport system substrate-binding protein
MPGTPFLGGSHWVAWANTHPSQQLLAGELIRFLTTKEATIRSSQQVGLLPARLDALNSTPFTEDPIYRVLAQGVKAGRTFPPVHLWGMIEDKLSAALGRIWAKVVQGSVDDIDSLILAELNPLAQRLNWVLASDMTKRN